MRRLLAQVTSLGAIGLAAGAISCWSEGPPTPSGASVGALSTVEHGEGRASVRPAPPPLVIDWPAAEAHPTVDPGPLAPASRSVLERVGLPVLLPPEPELLERAILNGSRVWYGASIPLDGATLYIHGAALAHPAPGDVAPRPEGERTLTRGNGIVTVAFRAFGAAYSAHLECSRPFEDRRCVADDTLLAVVDGLGVAGGRP